VVRTGARTPGRLAGIEEGDVLLAIDGVTVASLTLDQIIERCRGIIGSQVTLTVKRGDSPSRDIIIKREKISSDAEIEIDELEMFSSYILPLSPWARETHFRN
jgi:C-terminal processing protease CtpA/Prc